MATTSLIPAHSPFNYNVGINYESWLLFPPGANNNALIKADIDAITENFKLIKTFHGAGVGTSDIIIDPTQAAVIKAVVAKPGVELVMGTNVSALVQTSDTGKFSAGLMTTRHYTDTWVQKLIEAFGGVANVNKSLKLISLGNEIDLHGPPPGSPQFNTYIKWIEQAFDNLSASLKAKGLASIPVSTTIANYPSVASANRVASEIVAYIENHWSPKWNAGHAFTLFNQYTLAVKGQGAKSTDFAPVKTYFSNVQNQLGPDLSVFVGETGYSDTYGANNQKLVYEQIFQWLEGQHASGGRTVPLFAFDAFDRPDQAGYEVGFGIYSGDGVTAPTGLKPAVRSLIPDWTDDPINVHSRGNNSLYGSAAADTFRALAGHDTVLSAEGHDRVLAGNGNDLVAGGSGNDEIHGGRGHDEIEGEDGNDVLRGSHGNDTLTGGNGNDSLFGGADADRLSGGRGADRLSGGGDDDVLDGGNRDDVLFGRAGNDTLIGGRGGDVMVGGEGDDVFALEKLPGTDVVRDFGGGDHFGLTDGLTFADLSFDETARGTQISADGEVLAIVLDVAPTDLTADDFISL
ncbi:hypothetical protein DLJ53_12740 [Acuticoccus sediminis]|uniref:Hemolysin-type calcium-binding repeat-containing protein n=1 Tax=Acuticoccus sediminis TaxID=2184697 RepID=A0A8B2P1S5_9HYPH|nr:hypothetical protein [Acuticoccus sediminis]RAI02227.1 hypothetical protein DLJ53_12740 [Acuticoccus sediminis]